MAFVFLATQGVSPRHNEAVSHRHRSRLSNCKTKPRHALAATATVDTRYDTELPLQECRQPRDFDDDHFRLKQQEEEDVDDIDFDKSHYLTDDEEEEGNYDDLNSDGAEFSNNNDQHYDYNNLKKKSLFGSSLGSPVEAFPPSFIKWPLDSNTTKSKRIADIRKQVKNLSTVIKMTIESEGGGRCSSAAVSEGSPLSALVDAARVQSSSSYSSAPSSSLPLFADVEALLKVNKTKELKVLIRESNWGIDDPVRGSLWKSLVQHISKDGDFTDSYYWETVQQMYGSKEMSECRVVLPVFVDQKLMTTHSLSEEGVRACERIISVIAYNYPAITYAPLIYPITAIFMHYMDEPAAYNCVTTLASKGSSFISQTRVTHESMWRTLEILARKHMRGSYSMLHRFGSTPDQIKDGFRGWTLWLFAHLPIDHLVRIMDCFLLEGSKVLLRCSLSVFHLFMKHVSRDQSNNMATTLTTKGMSTAIATYCKTVSAPPSKLLKTAFGIRAFSKDEIKKIITQTELMVKSDPCLGGSSGPSSRMPRSNSLEGLPTSESQENIQMVSHTLRIKELLTIWSWIPVRMTSHHPKLVYTTEEHGTSLTNFYQRVGSFEPTILLVRTMNDEVFGAYCSTSWKERHHCDEYGHKQTYFGTGESFLFTLKPNAVRYEWVGITQQRQNSELSSVAHQSELFMHADNDMVSVGGGLGHGLMLDHDLQYGKTETCETFKNPPLCSTPDFEIKVIEVFSLGDAF